MPASSRRISLAVLRRSRFQTTPFRAISRCPSINSISWKTFLTQHQFDKRTLPIAPTRVERIPQRVPEQVKGKHEQYKCCSRENRRPPGALDQSLSIPQHIPPGRSFGIDARAEKG